MPELSRASGILLHISSLPGKDGVGDLGQPARKWIDFLSETGTRYWQILPLNPAGSGNSPYQGLSAFAGNSLFINLDDLIHLRLLSEEDLQARPRFPTTRVNYPKVIGWKQKILHIAFAGFSKLDDSALFEEYDSFTVSSAYWLKDYALFMAIRDAFPGASWAEWPNRLRRRDPAAIKVFMQDHAAAIAYYQFEQFLFHKQMAALRAYAQRAGIFLIGDIPIFMGYECADVWAHPELFDLGQDLAPNSIAGVPPDYFSATGQLWGNPLYKWEVHRYQAYSWWIKRIRSVLQTADLVRLDHFRGFAAYFRVPAGSETALSGEWVPGPGADFFNAIQQSIGRLPFIAEDLGVITEDVIDLRDQFTLPGMRVLQFAFGQGGEEQYLPHNYPVNSVAYTGTHDNDTAQGWYNDLRSEEKSAVENTIGFENGELSKSMIRAVWGSNAVLAIAPMQDFLDLDSSARMNRPSIPEGNWEWRMQSRDLSSSLASRVKKLNTACRRV